MAEEKLEAQYNHRDIESKWQGRWEKDGCFVAREPLFGKADKPKFYCLVEFPYPSGAGLHVGHVRSWAAMDAYARKKRMEGYNVIYPMGWDAFGLPAENYAIKMGIHPSITVSENIARFKKQCLSLGLSFDWSREINTTDPSYYKWTQWIFLQLYKNGLAYQDVVSVNWCPYCKTNLADEEVLPNGCHERCGNTTEKRPQKQWLLRITNYADRLLDDLKTVDYPYKIAIQQVNWIGRKVWADITYKIDGSSLSLTVSTTRPETNFGATFIVISPEHSLASRILEGAVSTEVSLDKIREYLVASKSKSDLERASEGRKKTGIFTGLYAENPLNGRKLPIWIADFVLSTVGTGAVVGVPGHDLRDHEFASEFNLPVERVVVGDDGDLGPIDNKSKVFEGDGKVVNSGFLDGLDTRTAIERVVSYLEEKGWGKRVVRYHLHDWVFSRQHYWGEPIPIIHCPKCGVVPVPEDQLPVELPFVKNYLPSGTGESPLATITEWVNVACPKCSCLAKRETDTMPNWAGSNWYFLRYVDPNNSNFLIDKEKGSYWLPVDIYEGGFEHTTLHLLYSRFIHKFLFDIKVVETPEPYAKRRSHGIVLGPDGKKMSKSTGNIINPDDIVVAFGADTLRLYEMFMGPFEQSVSWSDESLLGCHRFITRIVRLSSEKISENESPTLKVELQKLIKKVSEDLELFKFNTAIAALMEFINIWSGSQTGISTADYKIFLLLLSPFAPHIAEELWSRVSDQDGYIGEQAWPIFDEKVVNKEEVTVVIQVNGKLRDRIKVPLGKGEKELLEILMRSPKIAGFIEKGIKKTVFVPNKLLNIVV